MNLKNITNSRFTFLGLITLEKFKITLEQIFLTVVQNNYGNKIPFLISLKDWKPFQSCFWNDDSLIWRNYFWWEIKGEPNMYVWVLLVMSHSEKNFKGFLSKSLQLIDWSVGFWRKNKHGSCGKTQWDSKILWSRNSYILLLL